MSASKKLASTLANAAGAGEAVYVDDVFSTYLYTGNGSSQNIENGINLGDSNAGGSGYFDGTGSRLVTASSSDFAMGTGDFTIECFVNTSYATSSSLYVGVVSLYKDNTDKGPIIEFYNNLWAMYNGVNHTTFGSVTLNTWHHVAVTRESGTQKMWLNGTLLGSTSAPTDFDASVPCIIGGLTDSDTYPTTGYISNVRVVKGTALYTSAFTPPTSELTAVSGTVLLTCQGDEPFVDNSSNAFTITQTGNPQAKSFGPFTAAEAGEGGLVWLKDRDNANSHLLYDTERGATTSLSSNNTNAEFSYAPSLTTFNSNGFSLGAWGALNDSGVAFTSWTFRKAPGFFDVVTYTGDGTANRSISHNLGSTPGFIIVKNTSYTGASWNVWHRSMSTNQLMYLNLTNAAGGTSGIRNVTSTTFTLGASDEEQNYSGHTYVAYLFADGDDAAAQIFGTDGDQAVIKCGSFTATAGTFVDLGWEPQWVIAKSSSETGDWYLFDNMRGWGADQGSSDKYLIANTSGAEASSTNSLGLTPTGFTSFNAGGQTYIYIAIRRPHKPAESGTEVFDIASFLGDGSTSTGQDISTQFEVDLAIDRYNVTGAGDWDVVDRLRGITLGASSSKYLNPHNTNAENTGGYIWQVSNKLYKTYGFSSSYEQEAFLFKRSPGFFDVVCYEGNGTAGRTVDHNLGAVPEMMIIKSRTDTRAWSIYHSALGNESLVRFDTAAAVPNSSTYWNSTSPDSSVFTCGTNTTINGSARTYIAYLFASQAGISKVGSFVSDNTADVEVDCGFSTGARFVLMKNADASGSWIVCDTERGIVSGAVDPYLLLDSTAAEATFGIIEPNASGFTATSSQGWAGGQTYIYLAIA